MEPANTLHFTAAARSLSRAAAALGLAAPSFRSPPRLTGADRTLRRRGASPPAVAVRLGGRPLAAVLADMVDGVLAANGLRGAAAEPARAALWEALADARLEPDAPAAA